MLYTPHASDRQVCQVTYAAFQTFVFCLLTVITLAFPSFFNVTCTMLSSLVVLEGWVSADL